MFETLLNVLNKNTSLAKKAQPSYDDIAKLLNTNPEALRAFENAYMQADFAQGVSDNLFQINAKQMSELRQNTENENNVADELVHRIVSELLAQTQVYSYDPKSKSATLYDYTKALPDSDYVTKDEISTLPEELQPQLTGRLMKIDIPDSGIALASMYNRYKNETNPRLKQQVYHSFRQGLDILDVDNLTYAMIDTNPNSMGNWLPYITAAVDNEGFFKIPATKIIKLPISLLQLTRQEYMSLSKTTFDIVNEYCYNAFGLEDDKEYFIKTGTYSSKFDFRNARVSSAKEIHELGEYLLFIHWQALQMAHYDLSGRKQPSIYGVSTTTEWVVREFIPDIENNLTIYHGLPLRTEYRAFVDFDTKQVLGIHSYWDPDVMEKNFAKKLDTDIDAKHDYITYIANKDGLMARYEANKDTVIEHLASILPDINLHGQWSIDIMQNGKDFYIIDMAIAERSAFYECVPEHLRRPITENWMPTLPSSI